MFSNDHRKVQLELEGKRLDDENMLKVTHTLQYLVFGPTHVRTSGVPYMLNNNSVNQINA